MLDNKRPYFKKVQTYTFFTFKGGLLHIIQPKIPILPPPLSIFICQKGVFLGLFMGYLWGIQSITLQVYENRHYSFMSSIKLALIIHESRHSLP